MALSLPSETTFPTTWSTVLRQVSVLRLQKPAQNEPEVEKRQPDAFQGCDRKFPSSISARLAVNIEKLTFWGLHMLPLAFEQSPCQCFCHGAG